MLFCRAFIISRTGQNLEASMPNLHSPKLSGGKSTADVAGKRQIWSNIDKYWQYFPLVGTHGYDLFQMSLCLFLCFICWLRFLGLAKVQKSFRNLGWSWALSFPGEDPEDPWANQWWQCSKRTSGSFHSFHLWHWQISTCHNLFATYSQPICTSVHLNIVERIWTDKTW